MRRLEKRWMPEIREVCEREASTYLTGYALLSLRDRLRAALRDPANRWRYGPHAPRYGERLWINPGNIEMELTRGVGRSASGVVRSGDWDLDVSPLRATPKLDYCLSPWRARPSWEDAGAYAFMEELIANKGSADGCKNREDLVRRYAALDAIFQSVAGTGKISTATEARPGTFRECGGIYVHFARDARPIFGRGGHHRLAIALALDLPVVPVQVGLVQEDALDRFSEIRRTTPFG